MHSKTLVVLSVAGAALLVAGCKGPERKFGRGLNNVTEFVRMGEIRRSVEQTAIFERPEVAYTAGFVHGLNRSIIRTLVGAYEIVTFPIPSYEPWLKPGNRLMPDATVNPVYPDSYRPGLIADSVFETDTALGFSGGDWAPFVPGSRFHIFDY